MFEPRTAKILTLSLLLCGALFAGIGGGLFVRASRLAEEVEAGGLRARALCQETLRSLGSVIPTETGFRLTVSSVPDPRRNMADASAVMAACPDWTLGYFCMGKGCGSADAVVMIMELARQPQ